MNEVKSKIPLLIFAFICGLVTTNAQIDALLKSAETKIEEVQIKTPELRDQLWKWKAESEAELEQLETTFKQLDEATQEATETKFLSRRRIYGQTLTEISKHLLNLDELKISAEALVKAQERINEKDLLNQLPPYSILLLDELIQKRELELEKQTSIKSSIEILQTTLNELLEEAKSTKEKLISLQNDNKLDADKKSVLQSTEARERLLFIRASRVQSLIANLEIQLSIHKINIEEVSKQIDQIGNQVTFLKVDLEKVQSEIENREKQYAKELSEILRRQRKVSQEKQFRSDELKKIKESSKSDSPELKLAELHLETNILQLTALESISESLDDLRQIESIISEAYDSRFALVHAKNAEAKHHAVDTLRALSRRLVSWQMVTNNELLVISADVAKLQSRLATIPSEGPRLLVFNRQLTIILEKQALLQRVNQTLLVNIRMLSHWLKALDFEQKINWKESLQDSATKLWNGTKKLWNFPLKKYEKTIEEDGVKVTQTQSVSLGLIITALLLFSVAYLILSQISKRVQSVLVQKKLIGENQARTIRTWVMMVLSFLLALLTLNWLSIPLTIFAFLAGALAIGLGFGAQNIIKNFISGILLLIERNVRVGDIVEVDGTKGTVSEINIRSSIIRGFNGVEYLIPNSFFLENTVTNWTLNSRQLRCDISITLSSSIPIKFATEVLKESMERHGLILDSPVPMVLLCNFDEALHGYSLLFWIELNDRSNRDAIESELRIMIQKRIAEYSPVRGL